MKAVQVAIVLLKNAMGNGFVKRFIVQVMAAVYLPGSPAALKNNRRVRRMPRSDAMILKKLDWEKRNAVQRGDARRIDAQVPDVFPVNGVVFGLIAENPERKRFKIGRFDSHDLFTQACPYFGNGFIV